MRSYGVVERSILAVLALISWTQLCHVLRVLWAEHHYYWEHITLLGEIFLPVALFKTGVSFIGETGAQGSACVTAMWRFRALLAMGCICAGFVSWSMLGGGSFGDSFTNEAPPIPFGKALGVFILLSLVLALAQFEQVLRYSRDPLRFQIKFVLLGLGGLAGFSILQSTQPISFVESGQEFVFVSGLATLLSVGLITFGLRRWKKEHRKDVVHLSPQALYTSLTFLIVGGYFILIGGLGELVRLTGWKMSEAFGMLLVFVGVMALMVVAFSRQAKAELRLFVARHFFKSKYDYRIQWIDMIESFRSCQTVDSILDTLLELLGRTFGADRVTVWLAFEADGCFHQVRSVNSVLPPMPLNETHPLILELQGKGEILEVAEAIREENPEWQQFVVATHAVICAPLQTPESLIGFVTLSHELRNQSYSQDDFDLLRSMTYHVTMLLNQANLMEERTAAAKWEAMSRFSTFCLHDLKTLTAALSMVAQNAQTHGKDPAFQESAMRTVTNTVTKMTDLITKISVRSHSPSMVVSDPQKHVNINSLVVETVQSLNSTVREPVVQMANSLSLVSIEPEQFKQLLLNLVMNAHQSGGNEAEVRISTKQLDDSVAITIADSGPGIPASQLRTLFHPFKTTKKDGFGIGLFQCKEIVEQSQGQIRVESREGEGTKVCITLPAA
jgi:putative PEP-CTERM system histidine kinase